jgi:hypothetical protein
VFAVVCDGWIKFRSKCMMSMAALVAERDMSRHVVDIAEKGSSGVGSRGTGRRSGLSESCVWCLTRVRLGCL